jgi:hypothetical protein
MGWVILRIQIPYGYSVLFIASTTTVIVSVLLPLTVSTVGLFLRCASVLLSLVAFLSLGCLLLFTLWLLLSLVILLLLLLLSLVILLLLLLLSLVILLLLLLLSLVILLLLLLLSLVNLLLLLLLPLVVLLLFLVILLLIVLLNRLFSRLVLVALASQRGLLFYPGVAVS